MLEEIMLDKARIARHAAAEWAGSSTNWLLIIDNHDLPWYDLPELVLAWVAGRAEKVRGMTEAELTRAVKRYLTSWAQGVLRPPEPHHVTGGPEVVRGTAWDGMVEDLTKAERVARSKSGKKNLTPWVAPRGSVTIAGEMIDYTSHEFWSDMYLYGDENPKREGESYTAWVRRLGDAGANAKYLSERMPQPHNGTQRSLSIHSADPDALVAAMDGSFDENLQTVMRPVGANRRPMGLRDTDDGVDRPVRTIQMHPGALMLLQERGRKNRATEPIRA